MKSNIIIFVLLTGLFQTAIGQHTSTREDRKALFDYIIEKTKVRESRAPIKEETLGIDVIEEMMKLEDEVVNASDDVSLFYALQKLSSARNDRHLSVNEIEGGLQLPPIDEGQAPIRFHPDYSDSSNYFMFVADLGENIAEFTKKPNQPKIGDKLVKVNGEDFDSYMQQAEQYIRYSSINNLWRRFAYSLSERSTDLPPSFFKEQLTLTLERKGGKQYEITLPYLEEVSWQYGNFIRDYPGYELAWEKESFQVYTPVEAENKTLLLWWYGFRGDLQEATDSLIVYAEKNNMLDYDLIIDAIDSRGGSQGAYALARLSPHAFKTTGGNLKLSDVTEEFIADYTQGYLAETTRMDGSGREAEDDGTWVMEWLHGPVIQGLTARQAYSNNTPFKCAHLPHYSDWIMQPAEKHFTGNMVVFLGPWGGSHLTQFAAMVIDNDLGYTMGMSDGGYSNTWEWEEDLVFPISKQPVVEFMWSIGHTIRPNGQIAEGNAPMVDEFIPVTRDNYLDYKKALLEKARQKLGENSFKQLYR
ncbi:MAG: hypothetical protein RIG62_13740 [Cyclobacteriaceae bacterium]